MTYTIVKIDHKTKTLWAREVKGEYPTVGDFDFVLPGLPSDDLIKETSEYDRYLVLWLRDV